MTTIPRLSIVTTSFNQARFIEDTIKSVLAQSYTEIEFIVIDGGSNDGTQDILQFYKDQIDLLVIENDKGPADALNKGFMVATGDYFAFLNSDDVYDPSFAKTLIGEIEAKQVDLVYSDLRFIDKCGSIIKPYRFPRAYAVAVSPKKLYASACIIPQQGSLWSRRLYDAGISFNVENTTCWDLEFYVDAMCAGFTFQPVHKCMSSFRLHAGSITGETMLSSSNHVNSRLQSRLADHSRIKAKLRDYGYSCNDFEALLLKADNTARKTLRLISSYV